MIDKKHIGTSFDDFLTERGLLEDAEAVAIKRIMAYELEQAMKERKLSKTKLAIELDTSRAAVDRLLDPENTSITLKNIEKIAKFLGRKLIISFA